MSDGRFERHFWMAMMYGCGVCGYEVEFLLEDGCEGPKEGPWRPTEEVRRAIEANYRAMHSPLPEDWVAHGHQTASGRLVLPVPFVATRCPHCQPGPPPWAPDKRTLSHVRWGEDRRVDITADRPDQSHILYPDDWTAYHACGHPVLVEAP